MRPQIIAAGTLAAIIAFVQAAERSTRTAAPVADGVDEAALALRAGARGRHVIPGGDGPAVPQLDATLAAMGRYGPTAVRLAGLEPAWNTTGPAPARTDAGRLTAARFQ
jgi:hypothetical protein